MKFAPFVNLIFQKTGGVIYALFTMDQVFQKKKFNAETCVNIYRSHIPVYFNLIIINSISSAPGME
jgi:hypothetical protein